MESFTDEEMKDFLGGFSAPRCIICGKQISNEYLKKYPEHGLCSTACVLKWIAGQPEVEDEN
jgi:hypothetical protein